MRDGKQNQSKVSDALEQAMQSRLVSGQVAQQCAAVGLVNQFGDPEAFGPERVEMTAKADFVSARRSRR